MISCRNCGNMRITYNTKAYGLNLHTKLEKNNELIVAPEYYSISDTVSSPKLTCACGELEVLLHCDYCGNHINSKEVDIVTEKSGGMLIACPTHAKSAAKSSKVERVKVSSIKIIPKK